MAAAQGGYNFKVVLLGEGCVGKTSCVLRYVEDKFNDKHITTLQVSPTTNKLQLYKRVQILKFILLLEAVSIKVLDCKCRDKTSQI
jgi:GTPase SAR1 family protein